MGCPSSGGLRLAVKSPRAITHIRRLKGAEKETRYLIEVCASLGGRPRTRPFSTARIREGRRRAAEGLSRSPPPNHRPHSNSETPSWLEEPVFDLLRSRNLALCVSDRGPGEQPDLVSTATWGYLRLRRPGYTDSDLARWRESIAQHWQTAYVFFKHEDRVPRPRIGRAIPEPRRSAIFMRPHQSPIAPHERKRGRAGEAGAPALRVAALPGEGVLNPIQLPASIRS